MHIVDVYLVIFSSEADSNSAGAKIFHINLPWFFSVFPAAHH